MQRAAASDKAIDVLRCKYPLLVGRLSLAEQTPGALVDEVFALDAGDRHCITQINVLSTELAVF